MSADPIQAQCIVSSSPLFRHAAFLLLAIALGLLLLAHGGCTHSTGPDTSKGKHPRSYFWMMDTISQSPNPKGLPEVGHYLNAFWGMGDTLVYAVGEDVVGGYNALWKYDGLHWNRVKLLSREGGPINTNIELLAIRGFAPNDIYAFGNTYSNYTGSWVYTPAILHYDGIEWREVSIPKGERILTAIAPKPTQINVGGLNGVFYSYNGFTWSLDTIRYSYRKDLPIFTGMIGPSSDGGTLIQTQQYDRETGMTYCQFLKYKNKQVTLIDSARNLFSWGGLFWQSPSGTIYSSGYHGVYRLNGEKWEQILSSEVIIGIAGTSDNHIFAVGENKVYFYDGTSWEVIYTQPGSPFAFSRAWCTERQVFIACNDGRRVIVFRAR